MSLLLLLGCAPLVVAWPPPSALPTQVAPLDAKEVEVGLGVTPTLSSDGLVNLFQGTFAGEAGVGLGEGLSLTLSGSKFLLGPSAGAELAWWRWQGDWRDAGLLLGLAGAWSEGRYTPDDPYDDDDEEPVDYHYVSIAPSLGGQVAWKLGDRLSFPTRIRASYSRTLPNETVSSTTWAVWTELGGGVRFQFTDHLAGGAGLQLTWLALKGAVLPQPLPSAALSVQGRFGGKD